ncbi:AraD1 family protein [Paludibaculum fermentans]|uniref:AraD1 family protein n=1 Tax=Paludibaculum fermentans TaxID=1473598 RepID=UPI003EBF9945
MRLVQLEAGGVRRTALVDGGRLQVLRAYASVYDLAQAAIERGIRLAALVEESVSGRTEDYDAVYEGRSEWRLLPAGDHPTEPARCLVSGTGLTHLASASRRDAMHAGTAQLTDSMRMYLWGEEGGRPEPGQVGVAPEWFYKGNGTILKAHNEPLLVPRFGEDGGEEPEIAGVYLIDAHGVPRRLGLTMGNEFSDHKHERRNYLYLASSKLRTCSIGPELVVDAEFGAVQGQVSILRGAEVLWKHDIGSGEARMSHTLANLEHHHFKYDQHRRPGDVHVHYFGADAFSFGGGLELAEGDVMQVQFDGFGRPLRNPIQLDRAVDALVAVVPC